MANKKNNKVLGRKGENLAAKFLVENGFEIIDRNYQKKVGEIDLIAFKKGIIHFFEVKSVACETYDPNFSNIHRPEDNVTREKISRIEKTAAFFLAEKGFSDEYIQIDLLTIYFLKNSQDKFFVNYIPNINFL